MAEDREHMGESPTLAKIRALRRSRQKSLDMVANVFYGGWIAGGMLVAWALHAQSTVWEVVAALWFLVAALTIMAGLHHANDVTRELAQHEKDDENRRRYVQMALSGEHYVLWLRDFWSEGAAAVQHGPGLSALYAHQDPVESAIVSDIRRHVPTLALANPSYTDPDPPADRVWVHSSQWLTIVEGYARHASAVVLCAQRISPGVTAELDMLASTGLLDRTWLVLSSTARSSLASDSPNVLESARWVTKGFRSHRPLDPFQRYFWDRDRIRSGETTDPTPEAFFDYLRELPKRPVRRVTVELEAEFLIRMTDVLEHALSQIPTAEESKGIVTLMVKSQRQ